MFSDMCGKKKKIFFVFPMIFMTVFAVFAAPGENAGPLSPSISIKADRTEIRLGETITLTVTARIPLDAELELLPLDDSDFVVAEISPINGAVQPGGAGDRTMKSVNYLVKIIPLTIGEVIVPPLEAVVRSAGNTREMVKSGPVEIIVAGVMGEGEEAKLNDIVGPSRLAYPFSFWALPAAMLLAAAGIIFFFWRRGLRRGTEEKPKAVDPPDVWARRELLSLKEVVIADEESLKKYYDAISFVMRGYLSRRYGFPALERTTREISARIGGTMPGKAGAGLGRLLMGSDLVKFARRRISGKEAGDDLELALEIVEMTTPVDTGPSGPGPGASKDAPALRARVDEKKEDAQ